MILAAVINVFIAPAPDASQAEDLPNRLQAAVPSTAAGISSDGAEGASSSGAFSGVLPPEAESSRNGVAGASSGVAGASTIDAVSGVLLPEADSSRYGVAGVSSRGEDVGASSQLLEGALGLEGATAASSHPLDAAPRVVEGAAGARSHSYPSDGAPSRIDLAPAGTAEGGLAPPGTAEGGSSALDPSYSQEGVSGGGGIPQAAAAAALTEDRDQMAAGSSGTVSEQAAAGPGVGPGQLGAVQRGTYPSSRGQSREGQLPKLSLSDSGEGEDPLQAPSEANLDMNSRPNRHTSAGPRSSLQRMMGTAPATPKEGVDWLLTQGRALKTIWSISGFLFLAVGIISWGGWYWFQWKNSAEQIKKAKEGVLAKEEVKARSAEEKAALAAFGKDDMKDPWAAFRALFDRDTSRNPAAVRKPNKNPAPAAAISSKPPAELADRSSTKPENGWWRSLQKVHYINFGAGLGLMPQLPLSEELYSLAKKGAFGGALDADSWMQVEGVGAPFLISFEDRADAEFVANTIKATMLEGNPDDDRLRRSLRHTVQSGSPVFLEDMARMQAMELQVVPCDKLPLDVRLTDAQMYVMMYEVLVCGALSTDLRQGAPSSPLPGSSETNPPQPSPAALDGASGASTSAPNAAAVGAALAPTPSSTRGASSDEGAAALEPVTPSSVSPVQEALQNFDSKVESTPVAKAEASLAATPPTSNVESTPALETEALFTAPPPTSNTLDVVQPVVMENGSGSSSRYVSESNREVIPAEPLEESSTPTTTSSSSTTTSTSAKSSVVDERTRKLMDIASERDAMLSEWYDFNKLPTAEEEEDIWGEKLAGSSKKKLPSSSTEKEPTTEEEGLLREKPPGSSTEKLSTSSTEKLPSSYTSETSPSGNGSSAPSFVTSKPGPSATGSLESSAVGSSESRASGSGSSKPAAAGTSETSAGSSESVEPSAATLRARERAKEEEDAYVQGVVDNLKTVQRKLDAIERQVNSVTSRPGVAGTPAAAAAKTQAEAQLRPLQFEVSRLQGLIDEWVPTSDPLPTPSVIKGVDEPKKRGWGSWSQKNLRIEQSGTTLLKPSASGGGPPAASATTAPPSSSAPAPCSKTTSPRPPPGKQSKEPETKPASTGTGAPAAEEAEKSDDGNTIVSKRVGTNRPKKRVIPPEEKQNAVKSTGSQKGMVKKRVGTNRPKKCEVPPEEKQNAVKKSLEMVAPELYSNNERPTLTIKALEMAASELNSNNERRNIDDSDSDDEEEADGSGKKTWWQERFQALWLPNLVYADGSLGFVQIDVSLKENKRDMRVLAFEDRHNASHCMAVMKCWPEYDWCDMSISFVPTPDLEKRLGDLFAEEAIVAQAAAQRSLTSIGFDLNDL
eukprot:gene20391-27161_t